MENICSGRPHWHRLMTYASLERLSYFMGEILTTASCNSSEGQQVHLKTWDWAVVFTVDQESKRQAGGYNRQEDKMDKPLWYYNNQGVLGSGPVCKVCLWADGEVGTGVQVGKESQGDTNGRNVGLGLADIVKVSLCRWRRKWAAFRTTVVALIHAWINLINRPGSPWKRRTL